MSRPAIPGPHRLPRSPWLHMLWVGLATATAARGELPSPELKTIFPAGGQSGSTTRITLVGSNLDELISWRFSDPRLIARRHSAQEWDVTIPAEVSPGYYEARVVGKYGVSGPRTLVVGKWPEQTEREPNDSTPHPDVPWKHSTVVHGRLEKPGDVDQFSWELAAGEHVAIAVETQPIDSPAQVVLEAYSPQGKRIGVDRGAARRSPRLEFIAVESGPYRFRLHDAIFAGSPESVYRVMAGRCAVDVREVTAEFRPNLPAQMVLDPAWLSDGDSWGEQDDNQAPATARPVTLPGELRGSFSKRGELDYYRCTGRRGEVWWLEGFGARLGSPVDLEISVQDSDGRVLARFTDEVENPAGSRFPLHHLDPSGRWVVPRDGEYLVLVRDVIAEGERDRPRKYLLSLRREEPDFALAVIPRRADVPTGFNVWQGGREWAEVWVVRRRGLTAPIRITAANLPAGVECPETWLGPDQDHATVVVSAGRHVAPFCTELQLRGEIDWGGSPQSRPVRGGTLVRTGTPLGAARLTDDFPLALGPEAPLLVTATPSRGDVFQGEIIDVSVTVERRAGATGAIEISGIGFPAGMSPPLVVIPPGESAAWLSLAVPDSLSAGPYTVALQAQTAVSLNGKSVPVTTVSSPLTLQVAPARMVVTIDPRTPRRIARGQIIRVKYEVERRQGFIGKIHTELEAPGGVVGIRGRGVTFTGQTTTGEIQVIATENAQLGRLPFLRLHAVGTVEDQPVFRGGSFLDLEITE